jgi:hypothetical protein
MENCSLLIRLAIEDRCSMADDSSCLDCGVVLEWQCQDEWMANVYSFESTMACVDAIEMCNEHSRDADDDRAFVVANGTETTRVDDLTTVVDIGLCYSVADP